MAENLERLKQRIPLLEYLQRHNWKPCRAGTRQEFVGLCPLHQESRPVFNYRVKPVIKTGLWTRSREKAGQTRARKPKPNPRFPGRKSVAAHGPSHQPSLIQDPSIFGFVSIRTVGLASDRPGYFDSLRGLEPVNINLFRQEKLQE